MCICGSDFCPQLIDSVILESNDQTLMADVMTERFQIKTGKNAGRFVDISLHMLPLYAFPVFTIGRDPSCQLVLADPEAAPIHAVIARNSSGSLIIKRYHADLILTLDGEHIDKGQLYDGCVLRIGQSTLTFSAPDQAAPVQKPLRTPASTPARRPEVQTAAPPARKPSATSSRNTSQSARQNSTLILIAMMALLVIGGISIMTILSNMLRENLSSALLTPGVLEFPPTPVNFMDVLVGTDDAARALFLDESPIVASPDRIALLYFYADDCADCQQQRRIVDQLTVDYAAIMDTMFLDVDAPENELVVSYFFITALPQILLIDDQGEVLHTFDGLIPYEALSEGINAAYYG